jgi:hypothetical protein
LRKLSYSILGVVLFAVIITTALICPSQTGESVFWLKTFWLLVLVSIIWSASTVIFLKVHTDQKSTIFGSLPGINIVASLYSLISGVLIIYYWNTPEKTFHIIAQIVLGTFFIIVILLSIIAAKGAEIPPMPEGTITKEELLSEIKSIQIQLSEDDLLNMSRVRDNVKYSTPHNSKLVLLPAYSNLCRLILELKNEVKLGVRNSELIDEIRVSVKSCCL